MHTEGALEVAHVVKNMSSLKILDLNGILKLLPIFKNNFGMSV